MKQHIATERALAALATSVAVAVAVMAPPSSADAATKPARAARGTPLLSFEKYQLKNGLTVILHKDDRLPLAAVSVWYDVGGLHERPGRSGFAHLFEHMMFQGTPHTGADMHFRRLQEVGGTNINGTTDFDRTNYLETVPSHQLELALWLEADRMGFLLHSLVKPALDNQIEVVKNERRQSVENAPYGLVEERIVQTIFPKTHPYYGNVIGSMEDLSAATLDDVRDFFLTYYTPANATLAIAGDIDVPKTKAMIERYFGTITGRPKPPPVQVAAPTIEKETLLKAEEPVANLSKLSITWMAPAIFAPDSAELELLLHVLSGTRSSRLDKRLTHDDLIAQGVTARLQPLKAGSMLQIDVTVQPGRTLEEAQAAVDEVLADLAKRPPTQEELKRAQNAEETGTMYGLELLGGFSGRVERLQTYNLFLGDPGKLEWDLERYRKVTPKDLDRVRAKYLTDKRLIVHATPKNPAKKGA